MLGVDKAVNDEVSLLGWQTRRINRVCKSPTGAEVLNASACADEADFLYHLAVSFYPTLEFTAILYTDSYSLTSTQEKYTRDVNPNLQVDVAIIRQKVRNGEIILVHLPGEFMPADGLTKADFKAQLPLQEFAKNFRIGHKGIPMKVVDYVHSKVMNSLVANGKVSPEHITDEKLRKVLDSHYCKVVAEWDGVRTEYANFVRQSC